jgi:hypothetical protein
MVLPNTKVFIAFDLSSLGGQYFTLNDTTKGVLDNTIYPLLGDTYVDVTSYVKDVSVSRGASRELEGFQTGQATVTLNNHTRIFDPFYSSGIYYGQIVPKKKFRITSNDINVFTGTIDDWNLNYDISGDSVVTITCSDGFNYFSNALLDGFTNTLQLSGARINAILNRTEVNWPIGDRDIDTGTSSMRADTVDAGTEALGYLQTVALSENAKLFMDKGNLVTFDDASTIITRAITPTFSDAGTTNTIKYTNIQVVYGTENLYNRVSVTNVDGVTQTVSNTTSQTAYGISAYALDGLLLTDDSGANQLATRILGQYQNPELRIESVTVALHDLEASEQFTILDLELTDIARVIFTPNNIGNAIDLYVEIIGLSHNLSPDSHEVTISFRSVGTNPFILDDTVNGRLAIYTPTSYDDSAYQYDSSTALYDGLVTVGYELGA